MLECVICEMKEELVVEIIEFEEIFIGLFVFDLIVW